MTQYLMNVSLRSFIGPGLGVEGAQESAPQYILQTFRPTVLSISPFYECKSSPHYLFPFGCFTSFKHLISNDEEKLGLAVQRNSDGSKESVMDRQLWWV